MVDGAEIAVWIPVSYQFVPQTLDHAISSAH